MGQEVKVNSWVKLKSQCWKIGQGKKKEKKEKGQCKKPWGFNLSFLGKQLLPLRFDSLSFDRSEY